MLARQSCADGLRQHIKGLCGSVVSINGLSKSLLPSSFSTHSYNIMMKLRDAEVRRSRKWNWFQTETLLLLTASKMGRFSCVSECQSLSNLAYRCEGNCFMFVTVIWNSFLFIAVFFFLGSVSFHLTTRFIYFRIPVKQVSLF